MAERVRIQKVMSGAGLMSRRKAEVAIAAGRVAIDGRTAILGDRVDVDTEILTLDGVPLSVNPDLVTHLLYKPVGVISTAHDPQGRKTVVDLIESDKRLYPVGRLDADSEGLILLSNDGELTNRVTHPRYGITKTYLVWVDGDVSKSIARRLTNGIQLDDGPARAKAAKVVDSFDGQSLVEVVMVEGRNREVRRMVEAVGHSVRRLVRTSIGPISDPELQPGTSRQLSTEEITRLLGSGVGPQG